MAFYGYIYYYGQISSTSSIENDDRQLGRIGQALMYHQIRKYMLQLNNEDELLKYWRPQILLIVDQSPVDDFQSPVDADVGLCLFCNDLKKGGLVDGCVDGGSTQT